MPLTEEIKDAARQLGQALHQDEYIRIYLDALQATQTDPEASALEKEMYEVYEGLIARQQAGEDLSQDDTRVFYELRRQVAHHPLISQRNDMLNTIRPYLHQVAEEISFVLGADYPELTKPQ
ncbi:MAG: YlbF family regulator [Anaerolineales bacterium]|nr:YlbF family regulator [Anaerolineales bacterium]